MAVNGNVADIVRKELGHYPGVEVEFRNGGKHDRAVFMLGEKQRFMALPRSPSDWRSDANIKRDLKKTLTELGAERTYHAATKKGRRTRVADAAIGLNTNNLTVLIPSHSKLLSRFRKPDGTATSYWQFEIRASPDLTAPPLIAVKKADLPAGRERMWGYTRGTPHKSGGWQLGISRTQVPALSKMVESISSVDVEVCSATDRELVFKLPAGTVPTGYHPHNDKLPQEPTAHSEPEPEAKAPAPLPAPAPVAPQFPSSLRLELPKSEAMTVERAIRYLNKQKLALGQKLRFTVNEGGTLSAVHRIE